MLFGPTPEMRNSLETCSGPTKNVQGKLLQDWISKIAALSLAKIKWPANHGANPDLIYFSVDSTDCKVQEPHNLPDAPFDRDMKSEKFNKAGWEYLVALLVHQPQIVDIAGPFKATARNSKR